MVSPRNIRFALALLVTAAIVGIVAAITLKGFRTTSPEPVSQQIPKNIDVALHNARFVEMSDGTAVWELFADRAEYEVNDHVVLLAGVRGADGSIVRDAQVARERLTLAAEAARSRSERAKRSSRIL